MVLRLLKSLLDFLKSRICQRLAVAVFVGMVLVEVAILLQSVGNTERQALADREQQGRSLIEGLIRILPADADAATIETLGGKLAAGTVVEGAAALRPQRQSDWGISARHRALRPRPARSNVAAPPMAARSTSPGPRPAAPWRPPCASTPAR